MCRGARGAHRQAMVAIVGAPPVVIRAPWFRRWPRSGIVVAAGVYGVILAWRIIDDGSVDETAVLLCLPISLLAVIYGLRGGLFAGLAGAMPIALWSGVDRVAVSELAALMLLGALLGHAVDSWCAAVEENNRLTDAAARHREAVELQDTVVQGLAAAKWALEAGQLDRGLHVVTETLDTAQQHVSDLLRDAGLARHMSTRQD